MTLFPSVFHSVFKRRDVGILMLFAFLPLVGSALNGISDQQLRQDFYGSFLNFWTGNLETQYQLVFPALIIGFIVSSVFREEIASGQLFLYKDLKRSRILHAKLLSLLAVYGIYWLATWLITLLIYLLTVVPQLEGVSILPSQGLGQQVLQLLTITSLHLILILLVAAVSIKRTTLQAVLTGVFFNVVAQTAPLLNGFRYTFPNSYPRLLDRLSFSSALLISLGFSLLYMALAYWSARRTFNRIEF